MSWLSGKELNNLIQRNGDKSTKQAFLGVFAMDNLPEQIPHLPILLIINTQTSNLPGEHWKAVYISEDKYGEVFDSFALPVSIRLLQWMNTFSWKWIRSSLTVQSPLSALCGVYTLYYVLTRLHIRNMRSLQQYFSKDLRKNDRLMTTFYKTLK